MKLFFGKQNDNWKDTKPENPGLVWHRKRNFENSVLNFNKNFDFSATNYVSELRSKGGEDRKPQLDKGLLSIIAELEKKITRIHLSTRTLFKIMAPVHHYLRMKQSWYDRWHQTALATPTHWLTLIMVIFTMFSYSFIYFYKDGGSHPKAADPVTFASSNALYSGDFEGVNGVAGLNRGWATSDTVRSSSTYLGWDDTNFTRDAHEGSFAYMVNTNTSTETSQSRTMDFDIANQEFTLSAYMKVNELNTSNHGGIVISYKKNGISTYFRLCPGNYGAIAPTTEYQLFSTSFTFTDATSNTFSVFLYGPNYLSGTNPDGSAIFFDDISLTFTNYPSITLNTLTAEQQTAIYSGATVNCNDGAGDVNVYFPNCYTREDEANEVYVRISVADEGQSAYFLMNGHMGGAAPIRTRYISYVPNFSLAAPKNSELYLQPGESSNWIKLGFPYIYLNVLSDASAAAKITSNQPMVLFNAYSNDSMLPNAKFKVEVATDAAGGNIVASHDVDGASSAMVSIPRHLPLDGSGINFAYEEAELDTQITTLDINNSSANQLTDVPFSTGYALGKDFLDDNLYDKQNWLLRRLGINGIVVNGIQGPYSKAEKQQEAEAQGFTFNMANGFLNTSFANSALDYPLDQNKLDSALTTWVSSFSEYERSKINGVWVFEETGPPSITTYVASDVAQASFRRWLADLGLTPADFYKSDWSEVSMVLPQNADADETSRKEWYYSAKFRYEAISRFSKAMAPGMKEVLPNATIAPGLTDAFMLNGNAVKSGIFWPDLARNSGLNGMQTAYWENLTGTTLTASYYSAMFRSGLTQNNFQLWARLAYGWPGTAFKQEAYASLISGSKMFDFFNYGPRYLPVTDSASTSMSLMKSLKEVTSEFVPVQTQIKNSTRAKTETAILYSETSDIWHWADDARELGLSSDGLSVLSSSTLDRERQGTFFALENNQIPTDMVTEQTITLDNALSNYKVLYVIGPNVSLAAQQKIADWVNDGGVVYATTGAGMKDEYNQPSTILSGVLGVDYSEMNLNYIIKFQNNVNTSCWTTNTLYYLESTWHTGHDYITTDGDTYKGYCSYMDPLQLSNITDQNAEIIKQTTSEAILIKRRAGNGYAFYSNFNAGIDYLTKASVKYSQDRPFGGSYGLQSFSIYPGDAELALILTPYNQSGLQRTVVLSGDDSNSTKGIQIGVLTGTYDGKAYYLIPMNSFNQEVGEGEGSPTGDFIPKTLKVTINISDPSLVKSAYSVKQGDLAFVKISNAIEINSFTLDDTDIIKIELNSSTVPSSTGETSTDQTNEELSVSPSNSSASSPKSSVKISSTEDQNIRRVTFGQSISLEAPDIQTGYNYAWDFGDNTQASGSKVNHYYQKIDRFKVVLTTTNSSKEKIVTTFTIDVVPPPPELSKVDSNQKNVMLQGKALAGTEILITLYSDPYTITSLCGNDGNFDKSFDFNTTGMAYGDHKISLVARSTTKEGVVLDSDAKDYDAYFNLTENNTINAGLKNISPWYKKWYWIASAIILLISITAAATYLIIKRKGGGDIDDNRFGGAGSVFTLQGRI